MIAIPVVLLSVAQLLGERAQVGLTPEPFAPLSPLGSPPSGARGLGLSGGGGFGAGSSAAGAGSADSSAGSAAADVSFLPVVFAALQYVQLQEASRALLAFALPSHLCCGSLDSQTIILREPCNVDKERDAKDASSVSSKWPKQPVCSWTPSKASWITHFRSLCQVLPRYDLPREQQGAFPFPCSSF